MSSVDVSGIERAVRRVESEVQALQQQTAGLQSDMNHVYATVDAISSELDALRRDFIRMLDEQRRAAAVQKALTEIVRVRQEIENKFGTHKVVRDTMLGILQATDKALVTQNTISRVSEELMLSAPKYWLAPCLIAVAAWIGNNRDLADRAIKEAVRRDEEKTSLTMALICRRNGRTDTCFEWLSRYFANQSLNKFSAGTFTFVNAYINNVFGPDTKGLCSGYITQWMSEVRKDNANFEAEQEQLWDDYCTRFQQSVAGQYTALSSSVEEFAQIDAYMSRIQSAPSISQSFNDMVGAEIDIDAIKADIDERLTHLVQRVEEDEKALRDEEAFYEAVKITNGDEERARLMIAEANKDYVEQTVNLVDQMISAITRPDIATASETKTAVSFLSDYINKGYSKYITENEGIFPEQITLRVDNWVGKTNDGSNANALYADYENFMNMECQNRINSVDQNRPKKTLITAGVIAVLSVILGIAVSPVLLIGLAAAAFVGISYPKQKRAVGEEMAAIANDYRTRTEAGKNQIYAVLQQWYDARNVVVNFRNQSEKRIIA